MNVGFYEPSEGSMATSGGEEIDVGLARVFSWGVRVDRSTSGREEAQSSASPSSRVSEG